MPIITVTRQDVKGNMSFYQFWILAFGLLTIISIIFSDTFFIYHTAGLFLAALYWYFNSKTLSKKGDTISKTSVSMDSLKGSLMLSKATFAGWLFLSFIIIDMMFTTQPGMIVDTLLFFAFVSAVLFRRMRMLSKIIRK
jgi:hypothetical protein